MLNLIRCCTTISILFLCISLLIAFFSDRFVQVVLQRETHSQEKISIVLFEFENFDNDLVATATTACKLSSNVFIYSDTFIYPPLNFESNPGCHFNVIEKRKSPFNSYSDFMLHLLITTPYILVIPDSTRLVNCTKFSSLVSSVIDSEKTDYDAFLFPIFSNNDATIRELPCHHLNFDVRRWTLHYDTKNDSHSCMYRNELGFSVLIQKDAFFKLNHPFSRPFATSLFIQSHLANLSMKLINDEKIFLQEPKLLTERTEAKRAQLNRHRLEHLYKRLGINKVLQSDDYLEWHGCDRHTLRCFGTIVNDVPEYLIQQRWTPPCCLRNLEITGRYVFDLLEKFSVRYWLEGGSLLGAVRNGQIIEWDYDIDIGVYREDCAKLPILERLFPKEPGSQIEDGQGFLWEKAIEGDFVKVHFSRLNRIHVDIFAFEAVNGTMTKQTWFKDHPQDMPFPEHFLQPLTKVKFIGIEASAPNNVEQFLELKFGDGVIENPRYPRNVPEFNAY